MADFDIMDKKRKPGRPPNRPYIPVIEQKGIVHTSRLSSSRIELVYNNPLSFKSVISYFKNIDAREIHLKCTPTTMCFYARDHLRNSRVAVSICCNLTTWYFCSGDYDIFLTRENIESIFTNIDKNLSKLTMIYSNDEVDSLTFIFKDEEMCKECNYKIALARCELDRDLYSIVDILSPENLLQMFPIEFTLNSKHFKKTITDAANHSNTITFEKIADHPFLCSYESPSVIFKGMYLDSEKIKLRCSVDESFFRCSVPIVNIKPLSSSIFTNDIRILCRKNDDILFISFLDDNIISINTLTKLIQ